MCGVHSAALSNTFMDLQLLSLCLFLTLSAVTLGQQHGPAVIIVEEGTDVLLPCSLSTKENIESKFFDWTKIIHVDKPRKQVFYYDAGIHHNNDLPGQSEEFKGRVSHFQDELKHGNASIMIRNMKLTDSGEYDCAFPRFRPPQKFNVELIVGASPKLNIRKHKTKDGSLLLLCEVLGAFPKPEVEWWNRAGNKLPAEPQVTESGGKFNIILNITVTKTDDYTCVSTQKKINHQISDKISVKVHESFNGWIVVIVYCTLFVGVVVGVLLRHRLKDWLLKCLCCKKDEEDDGAQTTPNEGQNMILSPLTPPQNQISIRSKEVSLNADRADQDS